jgi:ATP-dependent RNA helicase RhlE
VHRIGRTGRAENEGMAITFVNPGEEYHFEKIEKIIRMPVPQESIPDIVEVAETPFEEKQAYAKEIDNQKRKENPDFKGAFHEKKTFSKYEKPGEKKTGKKFKAKKNRNQLGAQGKYKK